MAAANRDLAIRLSLKDAEIVRRGLGNLGADGQKALRRIETASAPASKGLLAVNDASASLKSNAMALTSRLGPLGSALGALGPAGIAAGAAVAAMSLGLAKGAKDLAEDEVSFKRLEAILRSTGQASGITADEIGRIGDEMEMSTLASKKAVLDAAGSLATFRSISGDAFTRALHLSQDMAAVFGTDLRSSATQLGKALEDPITGLTALRRVGVTFTQSQKDMITAMVEAGNTAEAQRVILGALETQMGGAGAGEAGGLIGATDRAGKAWSNFLKQMSQTTAVGAAAQGVLSDLTSLMQSMTEWAAGPSLGEQAIDKYRELVALREKIAEVEKNGGAGLYGLDALKAQVAQVEAEYDRLQERMLESARQKRQAEQGAANAERERNAEAMATRLKALEAERVKAASDAAGKIAAIETQLTADIEKARKKTNLSGVTQADVNKEVSLLREVAQKKIDAVQKPMLAAQQRAAEQTAKVLSDLQRDVGGVSAPRAAFVDQKVSALPKTATTDEIADALALAGELYDLTEKKKADTKATQDSDRAIERSRQYLLQHGDAMTVYELQLKDIDKLKKENGANEQVYALMTEDAEERRLRASTDAADGMKRAIQDYADKAKDLASGVEDAWTSGMQAAEDAVVQWATTGKLSVSSLADAFLASSARMVAQQTLSPIWSSLGTALAGLFHSGGVVGDGAPMSRAVSPLAFAGAARFHSGGLLPGEIPIIAQAGERVLTAAQQDNTAATIAGLARLAARQSSGEVKVQSNVYNNAAGTEAKTSVSRGADGTLQIDTIVETIEGRMARNIGKGRGLAPTLESRYGVTPAAGAARG